MSDISDWWPLRILWRVARKQRENLSNQTPTPMLKDRQTDSVNRKAFSRFRESLLRAFTNCSAMGLLRAMRRGVTSKRLAVHAVLLILLETAVSVDAFVAPYNARLIPVLSQPHNDYEQFARSAQRRETFSLSSSSSLQAAIKNSRTNNDDASADEYKIRDPNFLKRNKYWIIIVDDEEAIRIAVGDYLYDQGYQVTACADADAMLNICAKPKADTGDLPPIPDVIVSDIRMPGKDGLELLGLIRADERLERVPVVLLTAKALTSDRIAGYKAGADAYLSKPFDPDELVSITDNIIERRQQMSGENGKLVDLKEDMSTIKQILRTNGENVVKLTKVYLTLAEREVLEFLCKGYSNGEIAEKRGVSIIGVNRMISKMYLVTFTGSRTELVRWAIKHGYVSTRDRKR